MTPEDYAADFTVDLTAMDSLNPRSAQDDDGVLGASSFGCREQMRRVLVKSPKTDAPKMMPALLGSYCDAGFKKARGEANPKLLLAEELPLVLPNGVEILVHPDEIDQDEPPVTDYKAPGSLAAIKRGFADERYRRQRHLQFLAAHRNGLVPAVGITRNVFVDRSGKEETPWVEQEPFDMTVIVEATEFLDDAVYAAEHGETASKDTPRHVCKDYCPWFTACRGDEIVLEDITDPQIIALIAGYYEAKQMQDDGKALMSDLKAAGVEGMSGRTPTHTITSTWINAVGRTAYWKTIVELR